MTADDLIETGLERLQESSESSQGRFWIRLRRSRPALLVLAAATAFLQLRELPGNFALTTLNASTIMAPAVRATHVRLVTIDETDYQNEFGGTSPLDPRKLSELISRIAGGNPSAIVVDIETSHPKFRNMPVPAGAPIVWAVANSSGDQAPFRPEKPLGGSALPTNSIAALDLIPRDEQGIVRSYLRRFELEHGQYMASLEYAGGAVYKTGFAGLQKLAAAGDERLMDFKYWFPPAFSAKRIEQESSLPGWPQGMLHGQVVVLGGSYREARDSHSTPIRLMTGAEIVAQGIEDEIQDTGIPPVHSWLAGLAEFTAGMALILIYRFLGLRRAFLLSLPVIPLLSILCSWILFSRFALSLGLLPVLASLLITELYSQGALYLKICEKLVTQKPAQTKKMAAAKTAG